MHSAAWSVLQQLIRQALVAAFMVVLARKVTPHEFGLVGIANIWNVFLMLFLELGFGAALVQRKEIDPAHIAGAFRINLAGGAGVMLLSMACAWPVSRLMNAPEAWPVIFTISISFFVTAVAATPIALAQRAMAFKELAIRDSAANSIAALAGIALAVAGFGVWAVVANSLILNILTALFVWRLAGKSITWAGTTREALREVWTYGSKVFAYTGLKYFLRSADSMMVGALFGPEKLGLYSFAQRVTNAPTKAIQMGLATFLFPSASRAQEAPERLKGLFLGSFKALNYTLLIFSAALATVGMDLLLAVFGRQWEPAIEVIRILILVQLVAPAMVPLAELMKATNRPGWLLKLTIAQTAAVTGALVVGSWFGFQTSLLLMAAAWWLLAPVILWMAREITGLGAIEFSRRIWMSYGIAALGGMLTAGAWSFWHGQIGLMAAATILISGAQFGAAYVLDPDAPRLARVILRSGRSAN